MRGIDFQPTRTTTPAARATPTLARRGVLERPAPPPAAPATPTPPAADPDAVARAWRRAARRIRWTTGNPLIAARDAVAMTRARGRAAREQSGASLLRQLVQQWFLAIRYGMHSLDYYVLRLYLPQRFAKAGRYIHERAALAVVRRINDVSDAMTLGDKRRFAEACQKHGLPHVPLLAYFEDGKLVTGDVPGGHDLFIKCTRLNCGHGIELWRWNEDDQRYAFGPDRLGAAELAAHVAELSRRVPASGDGTAWHASDGRRVVESRPYVVQPRVRNHPVLAAFSDGPLCTARMVTVRPRGGAAWLACAVLRMPGAAGACVDNFNAGGLAAPIDAETGVLGKAIMKDPRLPPQSHHPNGAPIAGAELPYWESAVALVEWAHACFPGISSVGWDVGLTPGGPVLLEANYSWDCGILQMTHGTPLTEMPLAQWLLTHLGE